MTRLRSDSSPARIAGDGGVALPFIAVAMLVLLAFVAFAVDIGATYAVRRQSQSAADSAALGAAQELLDTNGNRAAASSYAKALSHSTVALHPSESEWESSFTNCSDAGRLAASAPPSAPISGVWTQAGATNCVSFSGSNQRVRVRIPSQQIDASFAALVGVETFTVSTFAEAIINFTAAGGGSLPYAITGNNAGLLEVCLNTGSSVPDPLCEGNVTGNFGALDFSIYGNDEAVAWVSAGQTTINLPTACSSNANPFNANQRLALNDILGVDHPLGVVPPPGTSPIRNDRTICNASSPPNFLARPNQTATETGNAVRDGTYDGLIHGMTVSGITLRGRFDRYCGLSLGWDCINLHTNGSNQRNASGSPIDDTPLWAFLSSDLVAGPAGASSRSDGSFRSVPASCLPSAFDDSSTKADMLQCLTEYFLGGYGSVVDANGNVGTVLFGKDSDGDPDNFRWDITIAPRFGFVPLLWDTTFPTGQSAAVRFREFRPIYFQTMYLGCNNNSCNAVHNPGEPYTAVQANKGPLDAISALALPLVTLPPGARDVAPAADQDLRITLVR